MTAASFTRTSDTLGQFATALAKAQAAAKHPARNKQNPHFKSTYADLASVIDAGRALNENGIAYLPTSSSNDGKLVLTVMLIHGESGEWAEADLEMPIGKQDAQGVAGTLTYLRRYLLSMVCNIASEEDDDGITASRPPVAASAPQAPQEPEFITARQVDAANKRYAEDGASTEDVVDWVMEATNGRTARLEEVYGSELVGLRDARQAWLNRTAAPTELPLEPERTP